MTTSTVATPHRAGRLRPVVSATLAVGAILTVVAAALLPWFEVDVHVAPGQDPTFYDVDTDAGAHHSVVFWLLLAVCLGGAVASVARRSRIAIVGQAATPALAALLVLGALVRAALTTSIDFFAVDDQTQPDLTVSPAVGLLLFVVGLAAVATAAGIGPRRPA